MREGERERERRENMLYVKYPYVPLDESLAHKGAAVVLVHCLAVPRGPFAGESMQNIASLLPE